LVSLNAEECITSTNDSQKSLFILNNKKVEKMRSELMEALNVAKVERLPIIKRWTPVPNYYTSSDDRILEYDFDRIVFETHSDFQHIKILHSPSLGNCLLLDDLQNLAEADISYTQALMKFGEIDYKDKEILILGGGDGGLLHELLKESPKFVTMVDIDAMVMSCESQSITYSKVNFFLSPYLCSFFMFIACKQHLRGCCGQSLDSLKGDNYEVIVGDCIQYMEEYVSTNRSFDFVFNDLTDIPISANDSKDGLLNSDEEMWAFFKRILILALQLVRPNGKYLNHVRFKL
jgi:spermine synthase